MRLSFMLLATAGIALSGLANAQKVFKCIDANGGVVFSQSSCGDKAQMLNMDTSRSSVEITLDKFAEVTNYSTKRVGEFVAGKIDVKLVVNASNELFTAQLLLVTASTGGWRYLECNMTSWLADGEHLQTGPAKHLGKVGNGGVAESISQDITRATLLTLAKASDVQYKICNDEYTLTPDELAGIKDVARLVQKDFPIAEDH